MQPLPQSHDLSASLTQGCKWSIRKLKLFLMSKVGESAANQLFADIQAVMLRALLAVQKVMINDKHCFELYGCVVSLEIWQGYACDGVWECAERTLVFGIIPPPCPPGALIALRNDHPLARWRFS